MSICIYNDDCFNVLEKLEDKSINLFVLDLPYGQTSCSWDSLIDLNKMWEHIKRTMKPNAQIIFFCTTKFGVSLINSNPKWFRYDLVWKKSRKVGFLSANKMPLRQHEMIYIFSDTCNDDIEITRNKELREYSRKIKEYINKSINEINKIMNNRQCEHFFYITTSQFGIPTKTNYDKLTKLYKLDKLEYYLTYDELKSKFEKESKTTYNSQKIPGKPYKVREHKLKHDGIYGDKFVPEHENKTGDRHPSSILEYEPEHEQIYIFSDNVNHDNNNDIEIKRNKELRQYAQQIKEYIDKSKLDDKLKNGIDHFMRVNSSQFGIPIKTNYNKLTKLFKLDQLEYYLTYDELKAKFEKNPPKKPKVKTTYNSQKTPGKPYKVKEHKLKNNGIYGEKFVPEHENKGDRHSSSILEYEKTILEFNNPVKSYHRTAKPVDLLEWLIKSYSNEGDIICDFTMGSGSAGIACYNTKRKFIGVELDKQIYKIAKDRLKEHCKKELKELKIKKSNNNNITIDV